MFPILTQSSVNDPYWSSVSLLMHMDGTSGSTTFTDQKGHTTTAFGNAQIGNSVVKYGNGAGVFDGTGDYVQLDGSVDFSFGTGDYTVECFARMNNVTTAGYLWDFRSSSGDARPGLYYSTGQLYLIMNGANQIITGAILSINTWYHIAVTRASGVTKIFVDGTQQGSSWTDSSSISNVASRPLFGIAFDTTSAGLNGYLDEVRVTKGVARYTGSFTPPTAQFPDS